MNQKGAEKLMRSEFTIGGEGAETNAYLHAENLSYSRTRGLFAGLVLKGTTLRSDDNDNRLMYGRAVGHQDILQGRIAAPAAMLNDYSGVEDKPAAENNKSK